MIDYGLFMMIYKPSKLIYSSVHIDRVYNFIYGIIFHEYHYIRISVLTDPSPIISLLPSHFIFNKPQCSNTCFLRPFLIFFPTTNYYLIVSYSFDSFFYLSHALCLRKTTFPDFSKARQSREYFEFELKNSCFISLHFVVIRRYLRRPPPTISSKRMIHSRLSFKKSYRSYSFLKYQKVVFRWSGQKWICLWWAVVCSLLIVGTIHHNGHNFKLRVKPIFLESTLGWVRLD